MKFLICLFAVLLARNSEGTSCEREVFGERIDYACPEPGDAPDKLFCCGPAWSRTCCTAEEVFLDDNDGATFESINREMLKRTRRDVETLPEPQALKAKSVVKIVGTVVGIFVVLVIVVIALCCCLPCCLIAKRRHRGTVHQPVHQAETQPMAMQYGGQGHAQIPPQPFSQPAYPAQQIAYPPAGQAGYPAQPQAGYPGGGPPPLDYPPPYPGPPAQAPPVDQYNTKQPAYNPNAS